MGWAASLLVGQGRIGVGVFNRTCGGILQRLLPEQGEVTQAPTSQTPLLKVPSPPLLSGDSEGGRN